MCLIDWLNKKVLIIGECIIIFTCGLAHLVFGFMIRENKFNVFEIFDSSPLFDFEIKNDCGNMSALILHKWGGRIEEEYYYNENHERRIKKKIIDETDIKIINKKYFCYKYISYKDLLNNGQIIKNSSECPSEYPKNCGKLDTLKQELCIKDNEKCPLYEIGIGNNPDYKNYIYDQNSNIYYNNEKYNKINKTIIGSLILNDGQPCYNLHEKLWQKFVSEEAVETHLKCDMEIYGKSNDDKYENKGNISYKRLYEDNLNQRCQELILHNLSDIENVSLYQREFLGINKECDKNYILTKDSFDKYNDSVKREKYLLLAEGFILSFAGLLIIIVEFILVCCDNDYLGEDIIKLNCFGYCIYMAMIISCFICHIVFFYRIKKYDVTGYDCSDSITNELIRKETKDNYKQILYFTINFYLDVFQVGINCLVLLIGFVIPITVILCGEFCTEIKYRILDSSNKSIKKIDVNKNCETNCETYSEINCETNNPEIPLNTCKPTPW